MSDKILAAISLNADTCETLLAQLRSQHSVIFGTLNSQGDQAEQRAEVSNLLLTAELVTGQLREQLDAIGALLRRSR